MIDRAAATQPTVDIAGRRPAGPGPQRLTLSGLVGQRLAPLPTIATLPVAAMMVGAVLTTLPASLLMRRIGRRAGFLVGTSLGGAVGGALAVIGVNTGSFWLFTVGGLFLGGYQAFATSYRFAAARRRTTRSEAAPSRSCSQAG